ncbi:TIGR03668 family PPOX class F420-dependent oxidoreductase [Natrinema sp. 1APR25-10V2]|uniref:TIGR03668 family PPOX class F420-dependent oxidoreductase n=1 Tax=Natrinema sp. 1APR25-10V2 TaxID=2951081 RepID=UPI0028756448|nr:TIGR03668 family PPOX class F420-dependent oxidoreductase [Natrinema sp. 1APR25-10V2]MDS0476520.1 TIGR03668 family PPOX class F420-dependent oxidoreductase [Natrinema sp. 1APR25-10V2]
MTPAEQAFLERARVAALATVDGEGRPHAVPICFALLAADETTAARANSDREDATAERTIVSAIDEKPKATRELKRVRNIRTNPRVTVLVDRYREDWSRLAWVQVRGRARILEPGKSGHDTAIGALEAKYDQYADHDLEDRSVIAIREGLTVSWGALE